MKPWAAVGDRGEADTLVCVQEALTARDSVQMMAETDPVAARMAFLESYKAIGSQGQGGGRQPEWRSALDMTRRAGSAHCCKRSSADGCREQRPSASWANPLGPKALPGDGLKLLAGKSAAPQRPYEQQLNCPNCSAFVNPEVARQALRSGGASGAPSRL